MRKTIGLCMIVKDEIADVVRIIKHYGKFFDKIFITVTSEAKLAEFKELPTVIDEYNSYVAISEFPWVGDFSKARNFNFEQADTDYVFWMDADDAIVNPEALQSLITKHPDVDAFYMNYFYAHDESGNCTMTHKRERLVKNNKNLVWKGRVHESLVPVEDVMLQQGFIPEVAIKHLADVTRNAESHKRNVDILVKEWNEHKEKTDPRTISYLAKELSALRRFDEANRFFEKHIQLSGWAEDKFISWNQIANNLTLLYLETKNKDLLNTAINAHIEAIVLFPEHPDAYLGIGECYWYLQQWEKAIEWTNTGMTKKIPESLPYYDPTRYTIRPLPILGFAYLELGHIDKAFALMSKALELAPQNPFIKDNFPFFQQVYNEQQLLKNFVNVAKYLEDHDREKLPLLSTIIPKDLAGDDRFLQLRHRYAPAKVWDKDSIVIFCGSACEEWAPPSVLKGVGGSEEAVIYLAKELTKLGHKVTVFNNCGDMEGDWEGVEYKNYWHFNKKDVFNTIISWRQNIFPAGITANKKIVWLHDVPFKGDWSKENTEDIDKIIVLSNYHRSLLPEVADEKIYLSTNGINVNDFVDVDNKKIARNPYRIIYGSAYNRGLEHLLDMWPEIRKEVPLAELHVFYGWQTFDALNQHNEDMQRWKASIVEKLKQPGIKEHGRVGHKRLLEEYAKSAVWAYPTFFKEINCLSAIKSQAMGCLPVYHNLYALQDTCKHGMAVQEAPKEEMLKDFKAKLIQALKGGLNEHDRNTMMISMRQNYSWERIANEWSRDLFSEENKQNKHICISDKNESLASVS